MSLWQENYHLFEAINQLAGRWSVLDAIMIFCADILIFLFPLVMLGLWGRPVAWRKRALRPSELEIVDACRAAVLWIVVACVLAYVYNTLIAHIHFETRPFITYKVHQLVPHQADNSFPSDHTAWSFAAAGVPLFTLSPLLFETWRKRLLYVGREGFSTLILPLILIGVALLMSCIIGFSRIFVGVHYPDDILAGALSGLCAAATCALLGYLLRKPTQFIINLIRRLRLA